MRVLSYADKMSDELFHAIDAPLTFSIEKLEITAAPGEIREGSFTVTGPEGRGTEGFCHASEPAVECLTDRFAGSIDEISYRADLTGIKDGDVAEGVFRIISTEGEYAIPYRIEVRERELSTPLGSLKSAAHFSNLAKTNWTEAVQLFYRPEFEAVLRAETDGDDGENGKALAIYRGLCVSPGNEQNVEEFLISLGKKHPVEFLPDTRQIRTELPMRLAEVPEDGGEVVGYFLRVTRNGWGYTHLDVLATGDFLSVEKSVITEEDFEGNTCEVHYAVDPLMLHAGKNFGQIILQAPYATITIPVEVHFRDRPATMQMRRREEKEITLRLMQDYMAFRLRKLPGKEWLQTTHQYIARLSALDRSDPIPNLYAIHAYLTGGDLREAVLQLQKLNRRLGEHDPRELGDISLTQFTQEDDTAFCYRLYLTALCYEDDAELVALAEEKIREKMKRNPGNWRIAWLYMYLSEEYAGRGRERLELLREQFERGCISPVLYIEAYTLVSSDPALLAELDDFAMHFLQLAAKNGVLGDEVLTQVNYLSGRFRSFSPQLYEILCAGYASSGTPAIRRETLESITSLLIKGNQSGPEYFSWYQKGVAEELNITRLYEYYMLSMPEDYDGEIPRTVLMYFAYQTGLPYMRTAKLYAYMEENRSNLPDLYLQYEEAIQRFVRAQLMQGRMSGDLAKLYGNYLRTYAMEEELAQQAVPAVYTCVIRTSRKALRRVIVIYDEAEGERYFPIENGICLLPLYGENNRIFFEDMRGMRYASSIAYTLDRLMDPAALKDVLSYYNIENDDYMLHRLSGGDGTVRLSGKQEADALAGMLTQGRLAGRFYLAAVTALLDFYEEQDLPRETDAILDTLRPQDFPVTQRAELIGRMIGRDRNAQAYDWVRTCDPAEVEEETLFKLCSRLIAADDAPQEEIFAEIVYETYRRGKYDEDMLKYLAGNLAGLTQELNGVRNSMRGFDLDTQDLTHRMFAQMLYSGVVLPDETSMIEEYVKGGGDTQRTVAILSQNAHYALTDEKPMSDPMFERIGRYGIEGVPLPDVCRIAYLKQLSERTGEITKKEQEISRLFLSDLLKEGIVFPFYRQFTSFVPELQAYANETLAMYHDRRGGGKHIVYHYAMEEDGRRGDFASQEMKEMYEGMYVAGFTLFFGEQMHYFITDDADEKNIVESGTVGQDARIMEQSTDRFGRVNEIAYLTTMHRNAEALKKVQEYDRLNFIVSSLFESENV